MPEPLPPFPVDPGTLDAIEGALHGPGHPGDPGCSVDEVLELLSGYDGTGEETVIGGAAFVDVGRMYSREDVILALITEVRRLRARPEYAPDGRRVVRIHSQYPDGRHAENCPGCAP